MRSEEIKERLKDIEEFLLDEYKQNKEEKKRDWRTYEQRLTIRIKEAIKNLEPLIDEATKAIEIHRGKGRRPELTVKQKVTLILLKELFRKSNRLMASMLSVFSLLSNVDVSYKTVERLYSDPEVEMGVHNLHILVLKKKKGVKLFDVDACGDGTGYSLTVRKHYASETGKNRDRVKEAGGKKEYNKKAFVYSFKMLDLGTKMYVAYGMSFRSEKQAFEKAMEMIKDRGINIESIRLDKYYSFPSYVDMFEDAKVYVIPRKNATLRGSWKWKKIMMEFVHNTLPYLEQYYLRNNSESGFSVDKRWFGWRVEQRREDRINTAMACTDLWHNLFNLYPS
ncbi:MAG: ISNCY family transposase [Thermoplasmatales archaeon]|nr:ISNCY family transposase [Thermoplasmatales archaeon]